METRRGTRRLISGLFHLAFILAAIMTVRTLTVPQEDTGMSLNIVGLSQYEKDGVNGGVPAVPPVQNQLPPNKTPPKHQVLEATPPPPVPPPPTDQTRQTPQRLVTVKPPPPATVTTQIPVHMPPPQPHRPERSRNLIEPKKTPLPVKQAASSAPASATHQPYDVKTWLPFSHSLQATLDKIRMQEQGQAPTHLYESPPAGQQGAVGNPTGSASSGLNAGERNAIGQHVRPCFEVDDGAVGLATFNVTLLVTTDAAGIVRKAVVAPQDTDKMSNPSFAAFAERAVDAVMSDECANLPLPPRMLGKSETLLFDFTP